MNTTIMHESFYDDALNFIYEVESHKRLELVLQRKKKLKKQNLLETAFIIAYTSANTLMKAIDYDVVNKIIIDCDAAVMREICPLPDTSETYTLYRGTKNKNTQGCSWTSSLEVANSFAKRCDGIVVTQTFKNEDILFYTNDRKEEEYFVYAPA